MLARAEMNFIARSRYASSKLEKTNCCVPLQSNLKKTDTFSHQRTRNTTGFWRNYISAIQMPICMRYACNLNLQRQPTKHCKKKVRKVEITCFEMGGRQYLNCRGNASPHRDLASPHRNLASPPSRFRRSLIEI